MTNRAHGIEWSYTRTHPFRQPRVHRGASTGQLDGTAVPTATPGAAKSQGRRSGKSASRQVDVCSGLRVLMLSLKAI